MTSHRRTRRNTIAFIVRYHSEPSPSFKAVFMCASFESPAIDKLWSRVALPPGRSDQTSPGGRLVDGSDRPTNRQAADGWRSRDGCNFAALIDHALVATNTITVVRTTSARWWCHVAPHVGFLRRVGVRRLSHLRLHCCVLMLRLNLMSYSNSQRPVNVERRHIV